MACKACGRYLIICRFFQLQAWAKLIPEPWGDNRMIVSNILLTENPKM